MYGFSALATGGAVVCSQFLGSKDTKSARDAAAQILYSTFFVAVVITATTLLCRRMFLKLVFGSVSDDVMANALSYFFFTALSYPFLALYNGGGAVFRAMGNSKISMNVSVIMNVLNFAGNALLIFVFKLGAAGAAISTLFARFVGAVIMVAMLHDKHNIIYVEKLYKIRLHFGIIRKVLHIGVPNGAENAMFQVGKLLTQSMVASFGTASIAANAVAGTLSSFEYAIGQAVGLSMITIVGRCVGAEDFAQAKYYVKKLLKAEYLMMFIMAFTLSVLAKPIISVYNLSEDADRLALMLILIHNVFICTIWPMSFTLPNSFRAANDVTYPMTTSILSMWVFRVVLGYVFGCVFNLGVMGIWLAMFSDWIFRGTLYIIRLINGKWLTKYKKV